MVLEYEPTNDQFEIKVPCRPEFVRTVRRAIADFAESSNVPKAAVAEIEVAASEAVTNIVRHAYPGGNCARPVQVKCARRKNGFTVEVTDRGCGFEAPSDGVIPDVDLDLDRDGGFGIVLIKTLMDSVNFVSKPQAGTKIRMTKRAKQALSRAARETASSRRKRAS